MTGTRPLAYIYGNRFLAFPWSKLYAKEINKKYVQVTGSNKAFVDTQYLS